MRVAFQSALPLLLVRSTTLKFVAHNDGRACCDASNRCFDISGYPASDSGIKRHLHAAVRASVCLRYAVAQKSKRALNS
jgi:hypothetical protein